MTGRPVTPAQQAADVLAVGDRVTKTTGYAFDGIVRAVFAKGDGETRVVVESSVIVGMLHIFAPTQLAAAGVLTDPDTHDWDAVNRVRALLVGPNIAPCEQHGYGPKAAIHSNCDWCAAFGMDQEWRDDLTAALDGAGTDAHGEGA